MQNWEGLVSVFDAEIAAAEDARSKAARMYKAAEVLEERLGRQEDAIARYNTCLQLQPGYLPAQKALSRLYERQGRFAELVAMYEQDLLQTADRDQLISTLNKMAVIYEDRLSDLEHAIECMKRILDLASDHLPTIRNLARLYERAGRYRELIETQELEASFAGDTKQVLSLYHRNAEILDEHLKDRAGSIAVYERVLALSPSYLPALKALGRLYAQEGRWDELIKMYRAEAEISPSTEQAATLHLQGRRAVRAPPQGPERGRRLAYQEALTLAPSYFPALRALARIYRANGHWEKPHRGAARRGRQPHRSGGARQRPLPGRRHLGGSAPAPRAGHRGLPGGAARDAGPRRQRCAPWSACTPPRTTPRSWWPSWIARRRWARRPAPRWPRT